MTDVAAHAKINLALVVGPRRPDGKHEVTTVYQRIALADRISLTPASALRVEGFAQDTLVRSALELLAEAAGIQPRWAVRISKEIPVAAGLGGGSSDAAAVLLVANEMLDDPLSNDALHTLARSLGADVPFFLTRGPHLGEGDGTKLTPIDLPQEFTVLLVLPSDASKPSTATVYSDFDARNGFVGYDDRRTRLLEALAGGDLTALPPNDLASSPLTDELRALGAFRADVTGAGPAVYGLFHDLADARAAEAVLRAAGRAWIVPPAW